MNKQFSSTILIMVALVLIGWSNLTRAAERNERDFVGAAYEAVVVNCNDWITLRYAPDTNSPSLARIPLGTIVTVFDVPSDSMGGFSPVTYNGLNGYCLDQYLKYHSGGGAIVNRE